MELRVLGCHGGESAQHRSTSFVLNDRVGLDAGATTSMLTLAEQLTLDGVLVSHAHLDHIRDLATLADNRAQGAITPLVIAGTAYTIKALREHFFNNVLWPDFTSIPLVNGGGPTVMLQSLEPEVPTEVCGLTTTAVLVSHTIESAGFVISDENGSIAFSGDTGPTDRFWEVLAGVPDLRALLQEVSFPDELEWLAKVSGHHTPSTLAREMNKLSRRDIPWLLYHIKPAFQARVERELSALHRSALELLSLGDRFTL